MHLHHMGHMTWCNLTWKLITHKKKSYIKFAPGKR